MKDSLIRSIKQFLHYHFVPGKPILLGFSGGNDSLALLDLLCHLRPFFPLEVHLAHVDHGWRKESGAQAQELKNFSPTLGLAFHLHTSSSLEKSEEKAREERLHFFRRLYQELGAQALVLAHHADDQAETVLKRIFEGASLPLLGAMSKVSHYEEMTLWRPLLDIPKKKLLAWTAKRALNPIQDETNHDERYLRGKMRQRIFPELNAQFGKEVTGNLVRLSEMSHELHGYLLRKTAPLLSTLKQDALGVHWDFNPFFPLEKLEVQFALKQFLTAQGLFFSRQLLQSIVFHLEKRSGKRRFGNRLIVDRGTIQIKSRD
ncbi:MAG TPA: tRNA lysidine(34) synthetase TilS [Rhabdochlamydiaceae bacterium]|nr:tRNA lysidine(34) synthetase TilS [Rhabdochlamydiaceae bacterium]